jgi:hypothetical protein
MSSAPIVDRIRIIPRPGDFLDRNTGSSGEVFYDSRSNTLRVYSGKLTGGFTVLTKENLQAQITNSGVSVVEYAVTVGTDPEGIESGNKYFLNDQYKPELNFVIGYTYVFNQNDSTNEFFPNSPGGEANQHPINFSDDNLNGELGGGTTYLDNVIYKLDEVIVTQQEYWNRFTNATQRSVQITITSSTPATLYYWCQRHTGMGNNISVAEPGTGSGAGGASVSVSETAPESPEAGSIWFNSNTGKLYVYISDTDSNQWVQPTTPFPSSILDLGITDGTDGQVLVTDGAGSFTFQTIETGSSIGNFTLESSTITTDDSSGITIVPSVIVNSDLTVENDLTVNNNAYATSFISNGVGLPEIQSASTLTLSAPDGVIVQNGPFRLPSFTTSEKNALSAVNGDMVYDTTLNKAQVYENGTWTNLA